MDSTSKHAKLLKVFKIGASTSQPPSYLNFTNLHGNTIQVTNNIYPKSEHTS